MKPTSYNSQDCEERRFGVRKELGSDHEVEWSPHICHLTTVLTVDNWLCYARFSRWFSVEAIVDQVHKICRNGNGEHMQESDEIKAFRAGQLRLHALAACHLATPPAKLPSASPARRSRDTTEVDT